MRLREMAGAVSVSKLTKIYRLYHGPRAALAGLLWGRAPDTVTAALQDVTFRIEPGETFGIVGDNGAGKSTLLKILAGTALPTSGYVEVSGRVAALLELGVGFHPEFTGRENIYFTGALMGLDREEVAAREAEIIAFSELGRFIDEPVKTYSSGMFVRLGFAVATGFDCAVLIIDEALAVGDQRFQQKCLERIRRFRDQGRTILFCSHNLYQVRTLCRRTLWLDQGRIRALGPSSEVVAAYEEYCRRRPRQEGETEGGGDDQPCRIRRVAVLDAAGQPRERFRSGEEIRIYLEGWFPAGFPGEPALGFSIVRGEDTAIYTTCTAMENRRLRAVGNEIYAATVRLRECPLMAGRYRIHAYATDEAYLQAFDTRLDAAAFVVEDEAPDVGLVRLPHDWL
ncbi:MAG: ABC transporter ATP-binding protein [Acidobacteriota bacterium]